MPRVAFNKFKALPPVCIVTGADDAVVFQRVKLTYDKRYANMDPTLALILMLLTRRRSSQREEIQLSLPFAPGAYEAWQRSKWHRVACLVAAGIFVDRNNSLLASIQYTNVQDYFLKFNLYPNVFVNPQLGMWAVVDKGGHFVAGVSFSHTLGVGAGIGTLGH